MMHSRKRSNRLLTRGTRVSRVPTKHIPNALMRAYEDRFEEPWEEMKKALRQHLQDTNE